MNIKFGILVLVAALSPSVISGNEEGASVKYTYKNGSLCLSSRDVLVYDRHENFTSGLEHLTVKLKNFNSRINRKSRYNPEYPFSTNGRIYNLSKSTSWYSRRAEIIKKKLANTVPTFNADLNLYEYRVPSETGVVAKYYLKSKISNLGQIPELSNLSDWYLGMCTDGFGDEPRCFLTYVYDKEIILDYGVVIWALRKWENLEKQISDKLDSSQC